MVPFIVYFLIALGTLSIAISSRTHTLWRLGLLFASGWTGSNLLAYAAAYPFDAVGSFILYVYLASCGFDAWQRYESGSAKLVAFCLVLSGVASLHYAVYDNYQLWAIVVNCSFIIQSLVITFSSLRALFGRNKRDKKLEALKSKIKIYKERIHSNKILKQNHL